MTAFGTLAWWLDLYRLTTAQTTQSVFPNGSDTGVQALLQKELPGVKEADAAVSLSVLRVKYLPGAKSRAHARPVAAFVYVLRGTIESQLEGEELRRYGAGEYFFEPAMHGHLVARNASSTEPAEFLTIFVGNESSRLTIPLSDEANRRQ